MIPTSAFETGGSGVTSGLRVRLKKKTKAPARKAAFNIAIAVNWAARSAKGTDVMGLCLSAKPGNGFADSADSNRILRHKSHPVEERVSTEHPIGYAGGGRAGLQGPAQPPIDGPHACARPVHGRS